MNTMQSFYSSLFAQSRDGVLDAFVRIAHASLREILAVRSELAWDIWTESR
jgi:hypothetical protein